MNKTILIFALQLCFFWGYSQSTFTVDEDGEYIVELSATDIDNQQLDFSVLEVEHADVSIDGQTLLISPGSYP